MRRKITATKTYRMMEHLKRHKNSILLIVVVALVIRLVVVAFLYQGQLNPRQDHWPFGYETGRIARAIASGRGFSDTVTIGGGPTAWMTPLYPYFAAGIFKLFGIYTAASAVVLLSLNSLFSALTCAPVFFAAGESFGPKVGVRAAWAWALFPYAIYLSADLIWETCLTTLLLSMIFLMTLRVARSTNLVRWGCDGLLWGITAMSNPAVLALLPFFVVRSCYRLQRKKLSWWRPAVVAMLGLTIVVTPWFLRNRQTFHRFIPFRDNFWLEVWVGNHGDESLRVADTTHPSTNASEEAKYTRLGEINYMAEKRREATAFIRSHPLWFTRMTFRRLAFTWTGFWSLPANGRWEEPFDPEEPSDPANIVFCTALSALAIAGLIRGIRERRDIIALYAVILLVYPVVYYVTNVEIRYWHPMAPELVILAAYACATFRWGARKPLEDKIPRSPIPISTSADI